MFFKYFSSSKETVRQFFSSLLSSQSFLEKINICSRCKNQLIIEEELKVEQPFNEDSLKFILKIKQELGFDLNVITPTIHIDTLPVPTCELVGQTGTQLKLNAKCSELVFSMIPTTYLTVCPKLQVSLAATQE